MRRIRDLGKVRPVFKIAGGDPDQLSVLRYHEADGLCPLVLHRARCSAILASVTGPPAEELDGTTFTPGLRCRSAAWEWLVARGGVCMLSSPSDFDPEVSTRVVCPHRTDCRADHVNPSPKRQRGVSYCRLRIGDCGFPGRPGSTPLSEPQAQARGSCQRVRGAGEFQPVACAPGSDQQGSAVRTSELQYLRIKSLLTPSFNRGGEP